MDFDQRLHQAIQRGQQSRDARQQAEQQRTLTEEELRSLHSAARLNLSEHIESCLRKLCEHFPGFRFETVVDEDGWGARINRDDLKMSAGRRETLYSRLQVLVRPFSAQTKIVEVSVRGTVRNREVISRNHFQFLAEFSQKKFQEMIDLWILEFAEQYAARH